MRIPSRIFVLFLTVFLWPAASAVAAEDLQSVLAKLDAAAKQFHSTSAQFVFDTEQTDPVPDTDIQKGTVYYERSGKSFEMAAHIHEHNGAPISAAYTIIKGVIRYRQGDEVHVYQAGKWESYLSVGFGASGTDLAEKWNMKYIGPATIDGKPVQVLELVAKDPKVREKFPKVTIWVDTERGVSVQQRFDEPDLYRIFKYSDIKVNGSLPSNAFDLKADAGKADAAQRAAK